MLMLPMQDADGNITRVLGGLSMPTPLIDPPLRFKIVEKMRTRIVAGTGQMVLPADSGFAEDASPFAPREQVGAERRSSGPDAGHTIMPHVPYLRIVTDNYGRPRK